MKPTHCIFSLVEGKLQCKVVELPEEPQGGDYGGGHSGSYWKEHDDWEIEVKQALANGVYFKLDEDVEKISELLLDEHYPNRIHRHYNYLAETQKPYKLPEGLEIEIKKICNVDDRICGEHNSCCSDCPFRSEQFAFLSKPKDVFDTGARLPEQKEVINKKCSTHCDWPNCTLEGCRQKEIDQEKEEDQNELWKEVNQIFINGNGFFSEKLENLKSKFTLTRKS